MLFDGNLEKTTSTIGLIAADLETTVQIYLSWQNEIFAKSGRYCWREERVSSPPRETLESLLPLTAPLDTRVAFVSTSSKWTAFFDNGILGTDAASPMPVMAERLKCETMRVTSVEHTYKKKPNATGTGRYGIVALEVYVGNCPARRSVYAANDGGRWVFGERGDPYQFENLEAYTRKRKRDRFTREMLVDYIAHFDAYPFDENWYQNDAFLLKKCNRKTGTPL